MTPWPDHLPIIEAKPLPGGGARLQVGHGRGFGWLLVVFSVLVASVLGGVLYGLASGEFELRSNPRVALGVLGLMTAAAIAAVVFSVVRLVRLGRVDSIELDIAPWPMVLGCEHSVTLRAQARSAGAVHDVVLGVTLEEVRQDAALRSSTYGRQQGDSLRKPHEVEERRTLHHSTEAAVVLPAAGPAALAPEVTWQIRLPAHLQPSFRVGSDALEWHLEVTFRDHARGGAAITALVLVVAPSGSSTSSAPPPGSPEPMSAAAAGQ